MEAIMTPTGRILGTSSAFALALIALAAHPARAGVDVSFVHPENYTDAGRRDGAKADAATLADLARHLKQLGERSLKPSQTLTIEVLDIDLAGRFEPWRADGDRIRFLRPVTWPRIEVRYRLSEDGRIVTSAEETLSDINYQQRVNARWSNDDLHYEKAIIARWFKARFAERS
jgi:hypothetical protein